MCSRLTFTVAAMSAECRALSADRLPPLVSVGPPRMRRTGCLRSDCRSAGRSRCRRRSLDRAHVADLSQPTAPMQPRGQPLRRLTSGRSARTPAHTHHAHDQHSQDERREGKFNRCLPTFTVLDIRTRTAFASSATTWPELLAQNGRGRAQWNGHQSSSSGATCQVACTSAVALSVPMRTSTWSIPVTPVPNPARSRLHPAATA